MKCPTCKKLVVNPKLDLGCATWCQHAEQCLGTMSSNDDILCKRLIREAKEFFGRDQQRIDRMLRVFQHAQEIASTEEADSRLVNAAAILSDIEDAPACKEMLFRCGVDDAVAERIGRIIATLRRGDGDDSLEARIVSVAIGRVKKNDTPAHGAGD
ncbi:MAG: hypothetical protein JSW27_04540 [Phycisphaerales bacterium]|nr:MAG: hypothetical protein JSW27_04540 [Phycisphaerales bacterium]